MDENLGLLGFIYSLLMPNMAEKSKQEVGSDIQGVGPYLGNGAS